MHKYAFDKIEDYDNLGGNKEQIKRQDAAIKISAILHIPLQRVIVHPNVELISNTSYTWKINKLLSGK